MALAININDLLNKQKIESNRIEFKKGWNPGYDTPVFQTDGVRFSSKEEQAMRA